MLEEIEGFILVGGASRRMGADKAGLKLGHRSFVERVAEALAAIARTVSVVGAADGTQTTHLTVVRDVYPAWGALGGLHGALSACRKPWAAVVACDLPFVTRELFVRLGSLRGNFDAVVPVQTDGRPQPLCALYRREACEKRAAELIAAGERRPRALLERVLTRWVAPHELEDLQGSTDFFANINTPEDYLRARERIDKG
ncbi:MAG TPA: molybdenum cofactor guanylyltransferase [Pyrinomonadaceae bacterium]|jgi:molybdopterin-guanine dinucleotide biosynthesis protein A|nr:molybdenum cofactor guanylyltransferase [Pyrinomonadaceae bacterium]